MSERPADPRRLDETEVQLRYTVVSDPAIGIVRIEFSAPIDWFGLPPDQARALARTLLQASRVIDGIRTKISTVGPTQ